MAEELINRTTSVDWRENFWEVNGNGLEVVQHKVLKRQHYQAWKLTGTTPHHLQQLSRVTDEDVLTFYKMSTILFLPLSKIMSIVSHKDGQ